MGTRERIISLAAVLIPQTPRPASAEAVGRRMRRSVMANLAYRFHPGVAAGGFPYRISASPAIPRSMRPAWVGCKFGRRPARSLDIVMPTPALDRRSGGAPSLRPTSGQEAEVGPR